MKTERNAQTNLPSYENYFILETSATNLAVDNVRAAQEPVDNIIGNEVTPNDSTNPMVDTIASNWDFEDIISNVEAASGPPPGLIGQQFDAPGGRPVDGLTPQAQSTQSPPTNPFGGGSNPLTGVSQNLQTNTQQPSSGPNLGGILNPTRGGSGGSGGRGGTGY